MKTLYETNMHIMAKKGLLYYSFPFLQQQPGLIHAFSSRIGGISHGCCSTLNLAYAHPEDTAVNVRENWRRFSAAINIDYNHAVLTQQNHTINIYEAFEKDAGRGMTRPVGYNNIDALITGVLNLPIITYHADCAPLFFYAPKQRLIGLAHAGWRGTALGMASAMVECFVQHGVAVTEILVGIGPSAGPCCYEIGEEVAACFKDFCNETVSLLCTVKNNPGKYKLNLWEANRLFLIKSGIKPENIIISGICTICNPKMFFSHRIQGKARGTMAAVMMLC
ncbi:MAG: peptidoglycan editing factor PgeF [Firmicutes bacterium]|nr:peptidoglycan editing factor PgeF [Bacillota bacterium]